MVERRYTESAKQRTKPRIRSGFNHLVNVAGQCCGRAARRRTACVDFSFLAPEARERIRIVVVERAVDGNAVVLVSHLAVVRSANVKDLAETGVADVSLHARLSVDRGVRAVEVMSASETLHGILRCRVYRVYIRRCAGFHEVSSRARRDPCDRFKLRLRRYPDRLHLIGEYGYAGNARRRISAFIYRNRIRVRCERKKPKMSGSIGFRGCRLRRRDGRYRCICNGSSVGAVRDRTANSAGCAGQCPCYLTQHCNERKSGDRRQQMPSYHLHHPFVTRRHALTCSCHRCCTKRARVM